MGHLVLWSWAWKPGRQRGMTFTIQCAVSQPRREMATEKKSLMIIDLPHYTDRNLSRYHALATPLSLQRHVPDLHEHAKRPWGRGREP